MKNRIKEVRKANNMSQAEFGARIGVRQSSVANYERGFVPLDTVVTAICREFNVNEQWLRTGEGPMKAPEPPPDELDALLDRYKLPRRLRGLFIRYGKLPEASQAAIREWLDGWILDAADGIRAEQAAAPKTVHDWTDAEMHAELQRQLDAEKRETDEPSTSFSGSSGAATA